MAAERRVVVTGATGMLGRALCRDLSARGYAVCVLSRSPEEARRRLPEASQWLAWSADAGGAWAQAVDGAEAVIHLAGAPIAGQRWTPAYQREILRSRVDGTRAVVRAIGQARHRPAALVCASGVDFYGDRGEATVTEADAAGDGFLPQVCVAWEGEAQQAAALGVRVVQLRIGIVLDAREGALAKLLPPFRLGLGGPILPGTQWWSWIHRADVVGLLRLAIEDPRASGPINATAPSPARCRDFTAALGRALGRPALIPIPLFALEALIGPMAGPLLVEKQRALPARALELGYTFQHPELEQALRAALAE